MTEHTHTTNTCAINARNGIDTYLPHAVGVGFKPQHLSAIMQDSSGVDWLEIHAENYMIDGGASQSHAGTTGIGFSHIMSWCRAFYWRAATA